MSRLRNRLTLKTVLIAGGLLVLVILVVVGLTMGWGVSLSRVMTAWGWFWWAILLLAGLSLGFVLWLLPRYRERRFLAQLRAEEANAPVDELQEAYQRLRDKLRLATRTLENAPDLRRKAGMPLYALPWYLLIGASQAGKTTLLRAVANQFTPFVQPTSGVDVPTPDCEWWFFNTAILLDTTGRYAFPTETDHDSALWYRLLQLLRHARALQPINGLIVAVGMDTLTSKSPEALRLDAAELRKRIDEVIRELGVEFPVYLLITRCDLLEGFTAFCGCLPTPLLKQAFGYVQETHAQPGERLPETTERRFDAIMTLLVERLQQVRLAIFNDKELPPASIRQKIFCFPEEFHALRGPLSHFADTLFAENPYRPTPLFRGLFFSSARQQGTPFSFLRRRFRMDAPSRLLEGDHTDYFLHDLFAVILPRDRSLVRPTGKASRGRRLRDLIGLGACLALCLFIVIFLTQSFRGDRRTRLAVDETPCRQASGPTSLEQIERCRQTIQALSERNRQRPLSSRLLFNRSGRLEHRLRQQFVETFAADVLAPLDTRLGQSLLHGSETVPLAMLLINRIELIKHCLSLTGCPEPIAQGLQPDYPLMLDPAKQQPPVAAQISLLQTNYETYLRWARDWQEIVRQERDTQADQLRDWFASKQFAPQQILLWANQHYPPVTLQAYWDDLPAANGQPPVQVEGAYTPTAWEQSIRPFLARAQDAVAGLEALLKDFEGRYQEQYFEQWRRFLVNFPRGELPWWKTHESRYRLALKLLDKDSPYDRLPDVVFDNLKPFLPAVLTVTTPAGDTGDSASAAKSVVQKAFKLAGKVQESIGLGEGQQAVITRAEHDIPDWVRLLRRFIDSDSRRAYQDALQQIDAQLTGDVSKEKSFELARAGFQERKPTAASTHPVLKAWWIIGQFREKVATGGASEAAFWPLLERPVLFVWKVILEEAAVFVEKGWSQDVRAPTQGLSRLEQVNALYGPQGKIRPFAEQFIVPFLTDNDSRFGKVLDEAIPLPPTVLQTLQEEKQLRPILEQGKDAVHRVRVEAGRGSLIDSQTNLVEEKTEFLIECAAGAFKTSNRSPANTEASTSVFWSPVTCGDAVITVFVSCDRTCMERAAAVGISVPEASSLPLVKRYSGQEGFLHFIQDFEDGSHVFRSSDFSDSQETLNRYRVSTIRVFYRLGVPSTLHKLIALIMK